MAVLKRITVFVSIVEMTLQQKLAEYLKTILPNSIRPQLNDHRITLTNSSDKLVRLNIVELDQNGNLTNVMHAMDPVPMTLHLLHQVNPLTENFKQHMVLITILFLENTHVLILVKTLVARDSLQILTILIRQKMMKVSGGSLTGVDAVRDMYSTRRMVVTTASNVRSLINMLLIVYSRIERMILLIIQNGL